MVQCPNKLLHNNDGHGLTLRANIAQKNHTIDYLEMILQERTCLSL